VDDKLALAGLTTDDFHSIREVKVSEFSGRVIVEVGSTLSPQPIERREPENLVAVHHDLGVSRYIFNPVE
jgi:hypothetical protein